METIHHMFATLDLFTVLINVFPAIINPLIHGFQSVFPLVFISLKHFVVTYPGLISGTIFISLIYSGFTLFSRLKKVRV
jgi:hypothetical protein